MIVLLATIDHSVARGVLDPIHSRRFFLHCLLSIIATNIWASSRDPGPLVYLLVLRLLTQTKQSTMPSRDLKICIHEWTPEQTTKIQGFYVALRGIWDKMVPWYQLEEPFSEAGAQRYRSNMKFGGDGWPAKTRLDDIARNVAFPSRSGFEGLYVRVVDPPAKSNPPKGVYLHFHGGGWTLGAADGEDEALYRIAKNTGYTVASVEYRLGPKHEYPAAIHDCVDAALFMLKNEATYGPLRIMGGESAGAHLAMSVTLALRHQGIDVRKQLDCLVLNYGCFGSHALCR